jgi:hypothetical protein
MVMGNKGGSMGDMEMPLPDNTLPMMTGTGPFGGIEMGGMFTTVKIRKGLARNDYKDPGWYKQPAGTQAYEWKGADAEMPPAAQSPDTPRMAAQPGEKILQVIKGGGHSEH